MIIGSAEIVIHAITSGFKGEVERAVKNIDGSGIGDKIGRDVDSGMRRGAGRNKKTYFTDKFKAEARQAAAAFRKLVNIANFIGPAISVAVGALSSLVSGAFALGSALGAALPAAAALGGLLSAAAQAGLTAKLAFSGLGKAISGLKKKPTGGGGDNNDDAIADARRRLAQAYQRAGDEMAAANDKVRKAQVALNEAYRIGAESLQQLGFDAEDAAIAQSKAAIELERARESLLRVQDMPADSRLRREAELAFQEADLNYRQATDRASDLAKEQEYAKKTGIEGTKEVLSARNDLAEAEKDLVTTQRDNGQDILEAQLALQKALRGNAAAASSIQNPLEGLSKEAARFARYIASLDPEFKKLKAAAGQELFPKLEKAIRPIVSKLFPVLIPLLRDTGGALGDVALAISGVLTSADKLGKIKLIGESNVTVLGSFSTVAASLATALINILSAARPLTEEFAAFLAGKAEKFAALTENTGLLTDKLSYAAGIVRTLGSIFGNLGRAFGIIGSVAKDAGRDLLEAFDGATEKFAIFAQAKKDDGTLKRYFDGVVYNVKKIGDLLVDIGKAFGKLGSNTAIGDTAESLRPAIKIFGDIGDTLTDAGPALGDLATSFAELSKTLTESGSIKIFFKTLKIGIDALDRFLNIPVVGKLMAILLPIFAVTRALGLMLAAVKFVGKALLGNFLFGLLSTRLAAIRSTAAFKLHFAALLVGEKITKLAGKATKLYAAAVRILNIAMRANPIGLIVTAVILLIAFFVVLYKKNERFRNAIQALGRGAKKVFDKVIDAVKAVVDWVKKNWPLLLTILLGPFGLLIVLVVKNFDKIKEAISVAIDKIVEIGAKIWGWILPPLKAVWNAVRAYFIFVFKFWKAIIETIIGIGLIVWNFFIDGITAVWALVTGFWNETIMPFVNGIVTAVSEVAGAIWDFISTRIQNVWTNVTNFWNETIMPFINGIVTVVSTAAGAVWDFISTRVKNVWNNATKFWNETIYPFIDGIVTAVSDAAGGIWNFISDGITSAWGRVTSFWDETVMPFIRGLAGVISGGLGNLWGGLTSGLETAVNAAIGGINLLIDGINLIISGMNAVKIGDDIPPIAPLKSVTFAAKGGVFMPKAGGNLAVLAEAGRPERVEPLDPQGLSKRDRAIVKELAGGGSGGGNTFVVNPSPGMDEVELSYMVARRVGWAQKRGA